VVCRWNFTPAHDTVSNGSFIVPNSVSGIRFGSHSITGVGTDASRLLGTFAPFPNPTSHGTRIDLDLPERSRLSAAVFDCSGRAVRALLTEADFAAGHHTVFWDGNDIRGCQARPGVYFVRFRAARRSWSERVAVVR